VPFDARGFLEQVGGYSIDSVAMGHKLRCLAMLGVPFASARSSIAASLIRHCTGSLSFIIVNANANRSLSYPTIWLPRQRHRNSSPLKARMCRQSLRDGLTLTTFRFNARTTPIRANIVDPQVEKGRAAPRKVPYRLVDGGAALRSMHGKAALPDGYLAAGCEVSKCEHSSAVTKSVFRKWFQSRDRVIV
jgi:hypothetical protein